jgi:uncharacterized protein (DUF1810 family)
MANVNYFDSSQSLYRFVKAQQQDYPRALSEIRNGKKKGHWMWYIFPQIAGLGQSATSRRFAIKDLDEATAYHNDPLLGARLIEIASALLDLKTEDAVEIFGGIDSLKLRSCMTLFAQVQNANPVFRRVLEKFFDGQPDSRTLELLSAPKRQ